MSSKKLSAEEELEKQYNDYKAQFEEWKERNKESVGTDAYVRYVKQFEDWERDVEKRRAVVRQKAEQERHVSEEESHRKADAERVARRRQDEAEAAAQRAAEQNRIANRQRRLVAAASASTAAAAGAATERQPQEISQPHHHHHSQHSSAQLLAQHNTNAQQQQAPNLAQHVMSQRSSSQLNDSSSPMETTSMANVMQQMLNFVRDSEKQQNGAEDKTKSERQQPLAVGHRSQDYVHHQQPITIATAAPVTSQASQQPQQQLNEPVARASTTAAVAQQPPEIQAPPQLWGSEGASYLITDPMFRRWNVRAAPPNFRVPYEPPPPTVLTNPYWVLVEKMRVKKLVLAPNFKQQLPPSGAPVGNAQLATTNGALPQQGKPPSLLSGAVAPHPSLGVAGPVGMPPPSFRPPLRHQPPPSFHHLPGRYPAPSHHSGAARPPVFNIPPPNFRLPPPAAAAAGGPPPSFYKMK